MRSPTAAAAMPLRAVVIGASDVHVFVAGSYCSTALRFAPPRRPEIAMSLPLTATAARCSRGVGIGVSDVQCSPSNTVNAEGPGRPPAAYTLPPIVAAARAPRGAGNDATRVHESASTS